MALQDTLPWLVDTAALPVMQAQVSRYLKSFRLHPAAGAAYRARVAHTRLGRLAITVTAYGGDIELDAGRLGHFSLLQWPLVGAYSLTAQGRSINIGPGCAHLIPPHVPVRMRFTPDLVLAVIRFSQQSARALGAEIDAERLLEQGQAEQLGLPVNLTTTHGASLRRTLSYVIEEAFHGQTLARDRAAGRTAETLLLTMLTQALAQPTHGASQTDRPVPPRYLARAEAFLLNNLTEPITLTEVAAAAGVSPSRLTQMFRQTHALAPMAWWRIKRLDQAYDQLSQGGDASVTEVGLTWGFGHLGRFAQAYAARFGETPRQTLQRARTKKEPQ